jgi:hypothetical protein
MRRVVVFLWSTIAMTGTGFAEETTIVTRSHNGSSYAEITQSGSAQEKPVVTTREGPGYVIIEQRSKNSRAVIIQQQNSGGQ